MGGKGKKGEGAGKGEVEDWTPAEDYSYAGGETMVAGGKQTNSGVEERAWRKGKHSKKEMMLAGEWPTWIERLWWYGENSRDGEGIRSGEYSQKRELQREAIRGKGSQTTNGIKRIQSG